MPESIRDYNRNYTWEISEHGEGLVSFSNGTLDAFKRFRVSSPESNFDIGMQYNEAPYFWNTATTAGGSITHLPNESSVELSLGTASGAYCKRQTKQYIRYQPGKSQLVILTGVMGAAKANVRQRIGYFDDNNGLFFEQTSTALKCVVRSNTSGTPDDNAINQSAWNLDKLDGTGRSKKTINTSKALIFIMDFEWLGVGKVRFGFDCGDKVVYCHEFIHPNTLEEVYMSTGNLPVRYEIENTDMTASATTMKQICSSVISEGGLNPTGLIFSTSNESERKSITTEKSILAIQVATAFGGQTNRMLVFPQESIVYSGDYLIHYDVLYNPTLSTTNWRAVNSNSGVQVSTVLSSVTGGTKIAQGYVIANTLGTNKTSTQDKSSLLSKIPMTLSVDGNTPDILAIAVQSVPGNATNTAAVLSWKEIY